MTRLTISLATAVFALGMLDPVVAQLRSVADRVYVLVPQNGTWSADYEDAKQILTIQGDAPAKAPDAEGIARIWGDRAAGFTKVVAAPGAFPLAIVRDIADFRGGVLRVEFKLIGGASDQSAGIAFNVKPDGSYLFARYNTKDGNVAVWKFENGARSVLVHGEQHEQLPLNAWHALEVTVSQHTVRAVAAGRLGVTHKLDAPVAGRVGVWTKADSVTSFRHFQASGHHQVIAR
jgi:hypothetical protein